MDQLSFASLDYAAKKKQYSLLFRSFWRPAVRCCVAAPSSTRR